MNQHDCPFCNLETNRIYLGCEFAVAFYDAFPITEDHTLVIPRRHVASLFDLPSEEQAAVWELVALVRSKLITELKASVSLAVRANEEPSLPLYRRSNKSPSAHSGQKNRRA